jgi:pantoate--beta-alanine ligase
MERLTTAGSIRYRLRDVRARGKTVGLVPVFRGGILHEGHLARIRRARAEGGAVVLALLYEPAERSDSLFAAAEEAGAELVIAPETENLRTRIVVDPALGEVLEGAHRPGYFDRLATQLVRAIQLVQPERIYLGEKDWQTLRVLERVVDDLACPVTIVPCATVREPDGLAISSENERLIGDERERAKVVPYLLATAQDLLDSAMPETQTDKAPVILHWLASLLQSNQPSLRIDYLAVVDPKTLEPLDEIRDRAVVAVALRFPSGARLTDSRVLHRR